MIIRGTYAMAAMNAMSYTWAPEWTAQMAALNDELEAVARSGENAVRENQPRIPAALRQPEQDIQFLSDSF